jgi:hypothetical protein
MFVFLVFRRSGITGGCLSFEDLSEYKIRGPTLNGGSFAFTSVLWKFHHRHIPKVSPRKQLFKQNL